jgi:hypothetical protein
MMQGDLEQGSMLPELSGTGQTTASEVQEVGSAGTSNVPVGNDISVSAKSPSETEIESDEIHGTQSHLDSKDVRVENHQTDVEPNEEFENPGFTEETEVNDPTMTAEMLDAMDTATLVTLLTESCRHTNLRAQRDQIAVLRSVLNDRFDMEKRLARAAFLAAGGTEEDYAPDPDPLFLLFLDTLSKYQQRRQQEREQRDREQAEGLRRKEEILAELSKAVEQEENGIQLEPNTIKGLQQRWNESGHVPAEQRQELWKRFQALIDRFYANLRINRELKELDMQKNLAFKIGLCEQVESLMLMSDLNKALGTLAGMHELWKNTGPVPREQREEVWQRFKLASDRIHERRRERQAEMDAVFAENLRLKTEVMTLLKDILDKGLPTSPAVWNELGQQVDKLQADWRAIGPVSREKQDELWSNFRALLSTFFEQRGQFFKDRKQEWGQLRLEAEKICVAAEELANSTDWKAATEALIALQDDWKKCNALPHKIREKYWGRFKAAKDVFFNRKKEYFKDQDARHAETKELLTSLAAEVEAFVASGEHKTDLEALQAFQRRWTAAPPLPLRLREAIHNRYRNALQMHYDQLHASSRSSNPDRYRPNSGSDRPNPRRRDLSSEGGQDADAQVRRDRNRLQTKLSELENDIRLWENNIHFFSMSKNADVLKAEVQSKIDKAKQEAERLKAQMAQNQKTQSIKAQENA